jgi:hypothetical protein
VTDDEPRYLITPPPGLLPEPTPAGESGGADAGDAPGGTDDSDDHSAAHHSATHRIERAPRIALPADLPTATPADPTAAAPVAPPADLVSAPAAPPAAEPAAATTPTPMPAFFPAVPGRPVAWSLVLPDGTELRLDGDTVLGRDPAVSSAAGAPDAAAVRVDDPAKTVSKTHARLEPHGDEVLVHDLGSTNGVAVVDGAGQHLVDPGSPRPARDGATIALGEYLIRLARR